MSYNVISTSHEVVLYRRIRSDRTARFFYCSTHSEAVLRAPECPAGNPNSPAGPTPNTTHHGDHGRDRMLHATDHDHDHRRRPPPAG
jgi:hypothetical protein